MPPNSKFEGKHRLIRWSTYLGKHVGEDKPISKTRLNNHLGGSQGVSRVSGWLNGKRGLEADTAWEVGRALRELGADTNEFEALWAAGFFGDLIRLIQHVAANPENGTTQAVRLFATLPARMLNFETSLCAGIESAEHGLADLRVYHALKAGTSDSHTALDGEWQKQHSLMMVAYSPELFIVYQKAWETASRGGNPSTPGTDAKRFRGDDDLVEIMVDAVARMKDRWIPSLLAVRIWRIGADWVDEMSPRDEAAFEPIPDIFLSQRAQREREAYVHAIYSEWAMESRM